MPRIELDLNPVDHITTDAIGKPGQRVFYIQATKGAETVTLIVEKVQIQTLALGVEDFLAELAQQFPHLPEASPEYDEARMRIHPPVDPLFRVGELALAYDSDQDRIVLIARELTAGEEEPAEEDVEAEEESQAGVVRLWCTRSQLRAMCRWGLQVAAQGRPICPYCGQPIDPEGHFCPKRNGHKH